MELAEFIYTVLLKPPPLRRAANTTIKMLLPETVKVGNAMLYVNPNDPVVSGALTFRVYERDEIAVFRSFLGPNMTLIDVGANIGLYTALALAEPRFSGRLIALEPDAESRAYLHRAIAANARPDGRVRVVVSDAAASDESGEAVLYRNVENRGDSRIYSAPALTEGAVVPTTTLDELAEREGIESVELLKIDVQGAEAKVVAGAAELLARSRDAVLMTEFWPDGLARCGSSAAAYIAMLGELGFALHELRGRRFVPLVDPKALIARTHGRRYTNLIGLKGRYRAAGRAGAS